MMSERCHMHEPTYYVHPVDDAEPNLHMPPDAMHGADCWEELHTSVPYGVFVLQRQVPITTATVLNAPSPSPAHSNLPSLTETVKHWPELECVEDFHTSNSLRKLQNPSPFRTLPCTDVASTAPCAVLEDYVPCMEEMAAHRSSNLECTDHVTDTQAAQRARTQAIIDIQHQVATELNAKALTQVQEKPTKVAAVVRAVPTDMNW